MNKFIFFLLTMCLLLGSCGPKPALPPTLEALDMNKSITRTQPKKPAPSPTMKPTPSAAVMPTSIPSTLTASPAAPETVLRDYFSFELSPNLVDQSKIEW